ncbi:hypothetical protein FORC89_1363 [Salmonella sp. FORC89]|nr:hypothetical protein SEECHS44_07806 [Salmonella enterica subsp. enterica serovar Enteritidis str. CHS44]UWN36807.1 hypothetical protein FORC89_1363 [Salmonella sp. FORC89]
MLRTPIDVYLANNFNIMKIIRFRKVWSVALQIGLIDISDQ